MPIWCQCSATGKAVYEADSLPSIRYISTYYHSPLPKCDPDKYNKIEPGTKRMRCSLRESGLVVTYRKNKEQVLPASECIEFSWANFSYYEPMTGQMQVKCWILYICFYLWCKYDALTSPPKLSAWNFPIWFRHVMIEGCSTWTGSLPSWSSSNTYLRRT